MSACVLFFKKLQCFIAPVGGVFGFDVGWVESGWWWVRISTVFCKKKKKSRKDKDGEKAKNWHNSNFCLISVCKSEVGGGDIHPLVCYHRSHMIDPANERGQRGDGGMEGAPCGFQLKEEKKNFSISPKVDSERWLGGHERRGTLVEIQPKKCIEISQVSGASPQNRRTSRSSIRSCCGPNGRMREEKRMTTDKWSDE